MSGDEVCVGYRNGGKRKEERRGGWEKGKFEGRIFLIFSFAV